MQVAKIDNLTDQDIESAKNQYVLIQNDMRYQIALLRHPTIHESHGWVTGATGLSSCPIFFAQQLVAYQYINHISHSGCSKYLNRV